jgi:sialic acid synthase SpsE
VVAAAFGADVVEKHITLGRDLPGTDHVLSADPEQLAEMVRQIRQVEVLLGSPAKAITPAEGEIQGFLRGRFRH